MGSAEEQPTRDRPIHVLTVRLPRIDSLKPSGAFLYKLLFRREDNFYRMDLGQLRKAILEKVKTEIINQKISVYREELRGSIEFNISGIKECINQPCSTAVFITKLNLISDSLVEALAEAEYIGYTNHQTHPKEHILGYHYFKTQLGEVTLYFNVQLTVQKKLILYTITEKVHL